MFTTMTMRGLLVVALSLSMIRVTLPGSDLVCAKHGSSKALIAHTSGSLANVHHHRANTHQGGHNPPCDTPSQSECCQALASCGMSLALGAEYNVVAPIQSFRRAETSRSAVLFSRVTAPEPPPPKA